MVLSKILENLIASLSDGRLVLLFRDIEECDSELATA